MRRKMTDATTLRPGTELETDHDETLTVTDRDGDQITWKVDGDYTETYTVEEIQTSLDHGIIEIVSPADAATGDDNDYEPEPVADINPSDVNDSDLYIRFGSIPDDERSYDSRNERLEDGVSVYACEHDTTDEDAPDGIDEAYYLTGTMLQTVFALATRDTYLVTGKQVGTGADGEPVIQDVEVVATLTSPKGIGGWTVEDA